MDKWRFFVFVMLGVIIVQVLIGILITNSFSSWTDRGTFGDMFGAVNTLFSGLAFAGVICAIILQQQELSLQREELKLTREELSRTASAQEKSEEALSAQAKAATVTAQLAAANYLYNEAQSTISRINVWSQGSPEEAKINSAKYKSTKILSEIEKLYDELRRLTNSST